MMDKETLVHELGHAVCLATLDVATNEKQTTIYMIQDGCCVQLGNGNPRHEISSCYSAIGAQLGYRFAINSTEESRQSIIEMAPDMALAFIQYEVARSKKDPGSDGERMAGEAPTDSDKLWAHLGWKMGCALALDNQFDIWHSKLPKQFVFLPLHAKLLLNGMLPIFVPTKMPVPTIG